MRKFLLLFIIFISCLTFSYTQTNEGDVFELASVVKVFLSENDPANLEANERYIQIGFLGDPNSIQELVGYMDRFMVKDQDMTIRVDATISEEMISYYKFYLHPLYDANNFQDMLEMFRISTFYFGKEEKSVTGFSNMVYALIKSKS